MKLYIPGLLLIAMLGAAGCASMGTSASFEIRNAPPPPSFTFASDPRFYYLPERNVAVMADDNFGYDMFSYNGSYYLYNDGYWYRSQGVRGRFVAVDARYVPRAIFDVGDHEYRWRNHPQGWHGQRRGDRDDQRRGDDRGDRY